MNGNRQPIQHITHIPLENVMGKISKIVTFLTYSVMYYNVNEHTWIGMLHTTKNYYGKNTSESFILKKIKAGIVIKVSQYITAWTIAL